MEEVEGVTSEGRLQVAVVAEAVAVVAEAAAAGEGDSTDREP